MVPQAVRRDVARARPARGAIQRIRVLFIETSFLESI
jgi:hypothetical protein